MTTKSRNNTQVHTHSPRELFELCRLLWLSLSLSYLPVPISAMLMLRLSRGARLGARSCAVSVRSSGFTPGSKRHTCRSCRSNTQQQPQQQQLQLHDKSKKMVTNKRIHKRRDLTPTHENKRACTATVGRTHACESADISGGGG